jgi:hypothetical protein
MYDSAPITHKRILISNLIAPKGTHLLPSLGLLVFKNSSRQVSYCDKIRTLAQYSNSAKLYQLHPSQSPPTSSYSLNPSASHVAATTKQIISLQTGQAVFFSRGVLHEASVAPDDAGRYRVFLGSNSCRHSSLPPPLTPPLNSISVHVTIGIDTQDITWEHALHALIDSQPPVSPHFFPPFRVF